MCEKCAKILNLDICGIDILFGEKEKYYICETNSNPGFSKYEDVANVNIAKLYAEYIIKKIYC